MKGYSFNVRQTFAICKGVITVSIQPGQAGGHGQTILLMNRSSSSSRSRIGLKDVSLLGGLNMLKNDPGVRNVNVCASIAAYRRAQPRAQHTLYKQHIPQKLMYSSCSAFKYGSAGEDVRRSNSCSARPGHVTTVRQYVTRQCFPGTPTATAGEATQPSAPSPVETS